MFRPRATSHRRLPRRGTSFILIVVVMLALFSAVGTAYALFAMREARLALARKNGEGGGVSPPTFAPDPSDTINHFFGSLIYGVPNGTYDGAGNPVDLSDLTNSMRGHEMARSMYGLDWAALLANQPPTAPWGGIGLFHEDTSTYGYPGLSGDRMMFVHHRVGMVGGQPLLLDPEYMGPHPFDGSGNPMQFNPATRTYISKAAGYSYPDLKDFFLASFDPATGQVQTPSFHRPWLFGSLDPTNPRWYDPTGWLYTTRPRPAEHPNFPRVPPNPDGTYTGDVQNFIGGVGPQRNDSLWMDIGLPTITLPGGRKVKPLVAPLIMPLNGLLNASVHGNNIFGGNHSSYHGLGPWEVNLGYVLSGADANAVVAVRGPSQQRVGLNQRSYSPYGTAPLPNDSAVAWTNSLIGAPPPYPLLNNLGGIPNFLGAGFQNNNAPATNHPSLFNPMEWPDRGGLFPNRIYQMADAKRFNLHYAGTPDWYSQSDLAFSSPARPSLFPQSFPYVIETGQATPNSYRLDPSHANRGLIATTGYDLDRPKLTPLYAARANGSGLMFPTMPPYTNPFLLKPSLLPAAYPAPALYGPGSDFIAQNRWSSLVSAISAVNLNRPLSDYRANTAQPLATGNLLPPGPLPDGTNGLQADWDRQQLARDIFARLIVATGAAGYVDTMPATGFLRITLPLPGTNILTMPVGSPTAGTPITYTQPQYDALRYLAQLAANIVDYIDNDDISTTFIWNPNGVGLGANFVSQADIGNRVVYGVEKPRLVINEAYGEITNDPTESLNNMNAAANKPAHVRFWLELLNPTAAPPVGSPLGTGAVSLTAYQIEIRRAYRQTVTAPGVPDANGNIQNSFLFLDPSNVTGAFYSAAGLSDPDAVFNLQAQNFQVNPNVVLNAGAFNAVYSPPANALPANGMILVGPPVTQQAGFDEFAPNGGVWANEVQSGPPTSAPGSQSMAYTVTLPNMAPNSGTEFRRHIVLLRRLANPYMALGGANQYVTVDQMDYVPAFDSIMELQGQIVTRTPGSPANATTYDDLTNRFSVGKVQPYAGHSVATMAGNYNSYSFPTSMVVNQTFNDVNTKNVNNKNILDTFGMHNGSTGAQPAGQTYIAGPPASLLNQTLMAPFDWLPHLDRTLVNQLELLQVRDTPPHRLTDTFVLSNQLFGAPTPALTYDRGNAQWLNNSLTRAMEYLTVRPYTAGVPLGGRVPGRINVNAIPEQRILQALMDPQNGNVFDMNYVTSVAWTMWIGSRTAQLQNAALANGTSQVARAGPPSQTFIEANNFAAGAGFVDRPFFPLGAPVAIPGSPLAYGTGTNADGNATLPSNVDLTILRRFNTGVAPAILTTGNPPMLNALPAGNTFGAPPAKTTGAIPVYPSSQPNSPSYFQAEPARKMLNNITTVNHQFVVILTIGYFEADEANPVILAPNVRVPRLGAEAYLNVPGDMRQKVFAVVDMSKMALEATTNNPASVPPFFTSLEKTAYATNGASTATLNIAFSRYDGTSLYVMSDGQEVTVAPGAVLVIGYGIEQQVVSVTGVIGPGQLTVQTMGGAVPFRTAWGGTCVSNVRSGYPGPQPAFDFNAPKYKNVLTYFERLK